MILNQFGYSLTFRRNIKYKALAFISSPIFFVLKQDTHAHGQMITASGNEIAWYHPTTQRKAVNTLKLINNWSHLFEECGLRAILSRIQDNWTFFYSDWILARFHLGKLLLMLKIYLLWKIWPYKKGETCVDTPFPQKVLWEKAMETGVDSRLCFIIFASFFSKARMKVHEHNIRLPFYDNNRRNRATELSWGYMYQSERIT